MCLLRNELVTKIIHLPSEKSFSMVKDKKKFFPKAHSQLLLSPKEELAPVRKIFLIHVHLRQMHFKYIVILKCFLGPGSRLHFE